MTGSSLNFDALRLAEWSRGTWDRPVEQPISGIVHDSRAVREGHLYVAIEGDRHDGHAFVSAAGKSGASGALVNKEYEAPASLNLPLLRVSDTREALKQLGRGYRCSVGTLVVGVTGSAGKTTVKDMIADVLETQGRTARTPGNWNNDIGLPLSLLGMQGRSEFGVFEVGTNHPGEIADLCEILQPLCGVLTNVGSAHVGNFGSVDAIADEKAALLRSLPAEGVAVLNADDPRFDYFCGETMARVVTVSMQGNADYVLQAVYGRDVEISWSEGCHRFTMPLPGVHVQDNVLRAFAVATEFGLPGDQIVHALENFQPGHMRWQEVEAGGLNIVNDAYNANPLSMAAAINAFEISETSAGKWLVLGGMHELGDFEAKAHKQLGERATEGEWAGVLFVGPHAEAMAAGAQGSRFCVCDNNEVVAEHLKTHALPGDTVLLKGSRAEQLEKIINLLN